jgi:hypothetical protein
MKKIILATLLGVCSILLFSLNGWFRSEITVLQNINQKHIQEMRRLHKIEKINRWLDAVVKPSLQNLPKDAQENDANLVQFFDLYAEDFHFVVEKYLYDDKNSHNLDINFEIPREEKETLLELMKLHFPNGFLRFKSFQILGTKIKGTLQLIQPNYENSLKRDTNAS